MSDVKAVENLVEKYGLLKKEISKIIVGQEEVVDQLLNAIFREGMPCLSEFPDWRKL